MNMMLSGANHDNHQKMFIVPSNIVIYTATGALIAA